MELPQQVVSLELSKRLKELGVKQESYFAWIEGDIWNKTDQSEYETPFTPPRTEWISAFTVAELGEIIWSMSELYRVHVNSRTTISCGIVESGMWKHFDADTEADAKAKMLVYLKENKLI